MSQNGKLMTIDTVNVVINHGNCIDEK
jgi:hypothetical protein